MYEFLTKLFGTVNGQPESLTAEQLVEKIKADKDLKIVNLSDGGYISEDKFKAKETELTGVKQQLADANTTIQSLKDKGADVDKVTKEWEEKYSHDTQELKDKLTAQERDYQTDLFLSGYNYTSKAARAGIKAEFDKKNYELENGKFGADATAFMDELIKSDDYKGAFVVENHDDNGGQGEPGGKPAPRFMGETNGGNGGTGGKPNPFTNFGFTRLRQPESK